MLPLLMGLIGVGLIIFGVALIYPPAAIILGGAALVRLGMTLETSEETA